VIGDDCERQDQKELMGEIVGVWLFVTDVEEYRGDSDHMEEIDLVSTGS